MIDSVSVQYQFDEFSIQPVLSIIHQHKFCERSGWRSGNSPCPSIAAIQIFWILLMYAQINNFHQFSRNLELICLSAAPQNWHNTQGPTDIRGIASKAMILAGGQKGSKTIENIFKAFFYLANTFAASCIANDRTEKKSTAKLNVNKRTISENGAQSHNGELAVLLYWSPQQGNHFESAVDVFISCTGLKSKKDKMRLVGHRWGVLPAKQDAHLDIRQVKWTPW